MPLGRNRLKALCKLHGLSESGREIAILVNRLAGATAQSVATSPPEDNHSEIQGGKEGARDGTRQTVRQSVSADTAFQTGSGVQVTGEGHQVSITVNPNSNTARSANSEPERDDGGPSSWPSLVWRWVTRPHVLIPTLLTLVVGVLVAVIVFGGVPCTQPNLTQLCYCPNGKTSAQTCRADLRWGPCACEDISAPAAVDTRSGDTARSAAPTEPSPPAAASIQPTTRRVPGVTPQKPCSGADLLTDANNCGKCGVVCPSGSCSGGYCTRCTLSVANENLFHHTTSTQRLTCPNMKPGTSVTVSYSSKLTCTPPPAGCADFMADLVLYADPELGSSTQHYQHLTEYGVGLSTPVTVPSNGIVSARLSVGNVESCGSPRNVVLSSGLFRITNP